LPKPQVPVRDGVAASDKRQRALGASGAAVETTPRRKRRVFTAAEKLRIVKKADACLASGERGAIEAMLREEGIYSSLEVSELQGHGVLAHDLGSLGEPLRRLELALGVDDLGALLTLGDGLSRLAIARRISSGRSTSLISTVATFTPQGSV
jgi:hypothetical protein